MPLKTLYQSCLKWTPTRRLVRLIRGKVLRNCGVSDPFEDISRICHQTESTLFLDIGCFHGDTILRFAESGVNCDILGIDPLIENVAIAKSRLSHLKNVDLTVGALSDRIESRAFFVNANPQTSSLFENDLGNESSFADQTRRVETRNIQTTTLDSWILASGKNPERTIVKCDVQGAEAMVIAGGKNLFTNGIIAFYAEVMLRGMYKGQSSFDHLNMILTEEYGFSLVNIYPCFHDAQGRATQTDILWIKNDFLPGKR